MATNIARYIDHTILKQATTAADVDRICVEASMYGFAAVCIPPRYVYGAKKLLGNANIKVATVIGFPLGFNATEVKVSEIEEAIEMGADELDMVIDLSALKSGEWSHLKYEIEQCLPPIKKSGKVIKLIVESGMLTDNELIAVCQLYRDYDINFMKTSTGYADIGATLHAVEIMRAQLPASIGIKASGGIRTYTFAKELIGAGATRLGCTASVQIMKEYKDVQQ